MIPTCSWKKPYDSESTMTGGCSAGDADGHYCPPSVPIKRVHFIDLKNAKQNELHRAFVSAYSMAENASFDIDNVDSRDSQEDLYVFASRDARDEFQAVRPLMHSDYVIWGTFPRNPEIMFTKMKKTGA